MASMIVLGAGSCAEDSSEYRLDSSSQELNAPPGLLAWWGGDGSAVKIGGTGSNYPAVYDGADYVPGKVGQAFHFDGKNYATLGLTTNRIDLSASPGFTLAAWIKRESGGGVGGQSIMDERDTARHFEWFVNGAGKVVYWASPTQVMSMTSVNDNQWHFVVVTHAKTTVLGGNPAGYAIVYVDGVAQGSALEEYSRPSAFTSVSSFALTRRSDPAIDIDELMVYGRVLTGAEIVSIYNAGSAGITKPVGYPVCGNGAVETIAVYGNAEECDDGNLANGDGCSTVCKTEYPVRFNIVSWWNLDATSNWALDAVGGSNAPIVNGSVWGVGPPGFSMAGGPDTIGSLRSFRVDLPDRPNLHVGKNPFTITLWVNARSGTNYNQRWVDKPNLLGTVIPRSDALQCCGDIKIGLGGTASDVVFQAGRANYHDVHALLPFVGTGWRHVAGVREANGSLKIYVDCQLKAARPNTGGGYENPGSATNRGIFTLNSGAASQIDEVMLFDKALTPSEICAVKSGTYVPPDADGDVVPDATDNCVEILNQDQTDTDHDGAGDACDQCVDDPTKTKWGVCGCGVSDTLDTDGDGTVDCQDFCYQDPDKIYAQTCGCGVSETDSDGDWVKDCIDGCPEDPLKSVPGECGCDVPDIDTDGDGFANCGT